MNKLLFIFVVCLIQLDLSAQQPSNTCGTLPPSIVPCSHSNVAFSVNQDGNAFDEINATCATGSDYSDGWYSVVGDGGIITVSVGGTNNLESCLAVFSGCATGEIDCIMVPGASAGVSVTFQSTNGSNYYIQIQRRSGSSSANLSGFINIKSQGSANISYPASSFCISNSVAQPASLSGTGDFSGGTFTSTPSGLSINSVSGAISPYLSIPGTYTINYMKTGSNGCTNIIANSSITIENQSTPLFTQLGPYQSGESIPALPTTSTNGIAGTWSPAINNTATTTYTFTPTAGQCATTATMTITINQPLQYALTANDSSVCAGTTITLSVSVIDQNSTNASCGAPDVHNANLTYGTVADQEGNNYKTIVIGSQEWMAENLKTSKYANGDLIPNVIDANEWGGLNTGAWVHYNNDSQFECPYGKLYNWYVVSDSRNVCPNGWHVPSNVEWHNLFSFLDSNYNPTIDNLSSISGGKMKTIGSTYWINPIEIATNLSGFSALPGGARDPGGDFSDIIGTVGNWWSSTQYNMNSSNYVRILSDYSEADLTFQGSVLGFSIRCIKD